MDWSELYGLFSHVGKLDVRVDGRAWTITAKKPEKLRLYIVGAHEVIRQARRGLIRESRVTDETITKAENEYQRLLDSPDAFVFHAFCRAVGRKEA